jgi:hypothetical protein
MGYGQLVARELFKLSVAKRFAEGSVFSFCSAGPQATLREPVRQALCMRRVASLPTLSYTPHPATRWRRGVKRRKDLA